MENFSLDKFLPAVPEFASHFNLGAVSFSYGERSATLAIEISTLNPLILLCLGIPPYRGVVICVFACRGFRMVLLD